jgi:acetyl esterase/lipase
MTIDRRTLLLTSLSLLAADRALAGDPPPAPYAGNPAWPPKETFPLWPGAAPGQPEILPKPNWTMNGGSNYRQIYVEGVPVPELHVIRPQKPNGIGILTLPGGGYHFLAVQNEGIDAGKSFNPHGVTLFVLTYRLPTEGWKNRENVPLQDAQRALRLIRARAREFGVDPCKIGVLGFSAGGHLAASLTTCYDETVYDPVDEADKQSARPDFAGLIYPVIDMHEPLVHAGSRDGLLGDAPSPALLDARSPHKRVTAETPPCFLVHAFDDDLVPAGNSLAMASALRDKNVPAELHVFEKGGHGFGFHLPKDMPGSQWPELFNAWISKR